MTILSEWTVMPIWIWPKSGTFTGFPSLVLEKGQEVGRLVA